MKSVEREVQGEICTIAGAAAKAAELLGPTSLRSIVVLGPAAVADMGVLARAETATSSVEVAADWLAIRHRTDSIEGLLVVTLRTKGTLAASGMDEAAGLQDIYSLSCYWVLCPFELANQNKYKQTNNMWALIG